MTFEESTEEAGRLFKAAGWRPHTNPIWCGKFTLPGMVGGIAPNGDEYVKAYSAFPQSEAHVRGLDPALYPDEPHEAAAVLIAACKPKERPRVQDQSAGRAEGQDQRGAAEEPSDFVDSGDEDVAGDDAGGVEDGPNGGGLALYHDDGQAWPSVGDGDPVYDADYDEVGGELEGDTDDMLAIDWEPQDFAPEPIKEAEATRDGVAIFGDDLPGARIQRIGQLALIAIRLIDETRAQAQWNDAEYSAVHSHVVTNLDKATGAYRGARQDMYDRFTALETARNRIRRIEAHRDERADFVRSADRVAVTEFNPEEGWP